PLYTPQGLQLELQIRVLNNLLETAKREDVVTFATIQRIQKEVNGIKDFIRFHKLKITIDEILEFLKFGRFWYFWVVYLLKGDLYTSITEKAFDKARENKDNSIVLNQCFKLIITSIRYHELAQESFEYLLNILENEWSNYLETDNWKIETSIKSETNSKLVSRKSSRRSSKVSKMTGNNDDILVDTSSRDQSSPPKNSSYNPLQFITHYENAVSSEERIKMLTYLANNSRLFKRNYEPIVVEAAHRRYYMLSNKKDSQDYIT
ncbi:7783_t:CDS:2, partial [Funneliformis geosporum]